MLAIPPQPVLLLGTVTLGFALRVSNHLVRGMSRTRFGLADHSRATEPTTWGPAIEVPLILAYEVSLEKYAERTLAPRAEISGFIRPEPSLVTGPRLLKLERALVLLIDPTEKAVS
jgi:hypothetical protein